MREVIGLVQGAGGYIDGGREAGQLVKEVAGRMMGDAPAAYLAPAH